MVKKFTPISLSSSSSSPSNSLTSSTDSSTSSSPFPSTPTTRCRGLNLLVKAIHQVTAGSVIGVPYIQKRVIRRRSRRRRILSFDTSSMLILTQFFNKDTSNDSLLKRQSSRRLMAFPSKYQDSVLQSWKPKTRYQNNPSTLLIK